MQIYKPGMGRLNSQPNSKSSNAKYDDDEKFKAGETEEQDKEEKPFKDGKNSGRQRDRNNRNYKGEIHEKADFKKHDREDRNRGQGKEAKDYDKYKSDDNRKRPEGKPERPNKSKYDPETAESSDAQKISAKSEGRSYNRDRDKRNTGRNFNERPHYEKSSSKDGKESSGKNDTSDKKDLTEPNNSTLNAHANVYKPVQACTSNDNTPVSTDPPKEKERSGKSYRSKRKEREQQRNDQ